MRLPIRWANGEPPGSRQIRSRNHLPREGPPPPPPGTQHAQPERASLGWMPLELHRPRPPDCSAVARVTGAPAVRGHPALAHPVVRSTARRRIWCGLRPAHRCMSARLLPKTGAASRDLGCLVCRSMFPRRAPCERGRTRGTSGSGLPGRVAASPSVRWWSPVRPRQRRRSGLQGVRCRTAVGCPETNAAPAPGGDPIAAPRHSARRDAPPCQDAGSLQDPVEHPPVARRAGPRHTRRPEVVRVKHGGAPTDLADPCGSLTRPAGARLATPGCFT